MKLRTFIALGMLLGTALGENALGKTLEANIFLAAFFIVLGLSHK
jgi:hypothetical protein